MYKRLKSKVVVARNYVLYRKHVYWAAKADKPFPLDKTNDFVITMASYPGRINQVPAVFESLARQNIKPIAAYLVLSEEDFPRRKLPKGISLLQDRGVEIVWCLRNPFAVKKLTEVWDRNPGYAIAAFDDDFIYAPDVLTHLKANAKGRKRTVLGYIGKEILRNGGDLALRYRQRALAKEYSSSSRMYLQGGLGTWYQPEALDHRFLNREAFTDIVPGRGSDIWFWAAAVAANAKQICISSSAHSKMFIPIPQTGKTKPLDTPGGEVLEARFQKSIDYFGIREKLLRELRDCRLQGTSE